jgi:heat-inducible transcriptional repressor
MWNDRKKELFRLLVEDYIQTGLPIGSRVLSRHLPFSLSPATIRNEMSDLEEMGYVTHPHTSAGRIPTEEGFRFYIDELVKPTLNRLDHAETLERQMTTRIEAVDEMHERVSRILATLSHQIGVVVCVGGSQKKVHLQGRDFLLDHPEYQDIQKTRLLLRALEDKQTLVHLMTNAPHEPVRVILGRQVGFNGITDCAVVISHYEISVGEEGTVGVVGPMRMNYRRILSLVQGCSEILKERFSHS